MSKGYSEFGTNNQPFVVPNSSVGVVVALPPSLLQTLDLGVEHIVSVGPTETVQPNYLIGNPKLYAPPLFLDVARKQVSKDRLGELACPIADAVDAGFRNLWGIDSTNWSTFNVWDTCSYIVTCVASRVFLGSRSVTTRNS